MSVIKYKQESNFTQVANTIIDDPNISMKAKGIYAYLYSKPIGWDFSGDRIVVSCLDGRKAIYSGLQELEEAGYIKREKESDGRVTYSLFTNPNDQKGQLGIEPVAHFGKQPKRQIAEMGSISNTDIKVISNYNNTKEAHGEFQNVFLSKEELEKLKSSAGFQVAQQVIEELSTYIAANGYEKKYKSHYATLITWIRRKGEEKIKRKVTMLN